MLVETARGRNHSETEYRDMLAGASFVDLRVVPIDAAGANGVIVAARYLQGPVRASDAMQVASRARRSARPLSVATAPSGKASGGAVDTEWGPRGRSSGAGEHGLEAGECASRVFDVEPVVGCGDPSEDEQRQGVCRTSDHAVGAARVVGGFPAA